MSSYKYKNCRFWGCYVLNIFNNIDDPNLNKKYLKVINLILIILKERLVQQAHDKFFLNNYKLFSFL